MRFSRLYGTLAVLPVSICANLRERPRSPATWPTIVSRTMPRWALTPIARPRRAPLSIDDRRTPSHPRFFVVYLRPKYLAQWPASVPQMDDLSPNLQQALSYAVKLYA
ncbi:hypothetical protein C8Q73DRAFT_535221 [Cubamyces lactineus]|nr:hypothetical protein C8Q73DRAFT_535221 [Cubamyces lactineus]